MAKTIDIKNLPDFITDEQMQNLENQEVVETVPNYSEFNSNNAPDVLTNEQMDTLARQESNFKPKKVPFLKSIGNSLISSEKNLGNTIGGLIAAPSVQKSLNETNQQTSDILLNLAKKIKTDKAQGKDVSHLMEVYNQVSGFQNPVSASEIIPSLNKTNKQVIGEFGGVALDALAPGLGKVKAVAKTAPLIQKATALATKAGVGAGIGYGYDVTQGLQNNEEQPFKPGLGTVIGGILPTVIPTIRGISRGVSEVSGALTGQGRGGQKALSEAIQAGGEQASTARAAMRGNIKPEAVQQEAQSALNKINSAKTQEYQQALSTLKENKKSYDISPVVEKLNSQLEEFGIKKTPNGTLDFSASPLRFNSEAKNDISTIFEEMKTFGSKPGDRTVVGLDSLKRAFNDLYTPSGEARKFVTGMSSEVRKILNEVPGYEEMARNYGEKTGLIKEIQQNLSLGTRPGADAAYKKLSQVLRNDTDARRQLLEELNTASGGKLKPMIAGSLASPILPRGLTRLTTGLAGVATGTQAGGGGLIPILKSILIAGGSTSPRLAGELINILGVSAKNTEKARNVLRNIFVEEPLVPMKLIKKGKDNSNLE